MFQIYEARQKKIFKNSSPLLLKSLAFHFSRKCFLFFITENICFFFYLLNLFFSTKQFIFQGYFFSCFYFLSEIISFNLFLWYFSFFDGLLDFLILSYLRFLLKSDLNLNEGMNQRFFVIFKNTVS